MSEGERFYKSWEVPADFGKPQRKSGGKRQKLDNQMTESEVVERLKYAFPAPAHVVLPQVKFPGQDGEKDRTIDAICASVYPSRGLWLAAIEVKVTRTDYMKELRDPQKQESLLRYCHYYYLATPTGLISPEELFGGLGLLHVRADGAKVVKRAELRENVYEPDLRLVCSILRAASVSLANTTQEDDEDKEVDGQDA